MNQADPFAIALINAYRTGVPCDVAQSIGPLTTPLAYATQRAVWLAMVGNVRPTAWKVGAPAQDAEPVAAPVFPARLTASPARLGRALFTKLGVEAEIAFRFGRDLPARPTPYTRPEIIAAIASAHVSMELVDSRLADPQAAGPLWCLADNLLNGALVVGDAIPGWRDLDFSAQTARVHAGAAMIHASLGRPPLDDLFHCLAWWIEHVGGARRGDLVTTGAWSGMHPVALPNHLEVEFAELGVARASVG